MYIIYKLGDSMRFHIKTKRSNYWIVNLMLAIILCTFTVLSLIKIEKPEQIIAAEVVNTNTIKTTKIKEYTITMYNHNSNKCEMLKLDDYAAGVLAAEMPASYDVEALKAQAIAIRTLAYRAMNQKKGCNECDVCSESGHCQAYASLSRRINMWDKDFDKWQSRILAAIKDTKGLIMTYNGLPIEVFYHAASNGMTENSQAVFSVSRPYLVSVDSPDANLNSDIKRFTYQSFIALLNEAINGLKLPEGGLENSIEIYSRTKSGRVDTIQVKDIIVSGVKFRKALGIQSTDFEISFYDNTVQINTKGFGHGVGMSQKGANTMAKNGSIYDEILLHYYTGIVLIDITDTD